MSSVCSKPESQLKLISHNAPWARMYPTHPGQSGAASLAEALSHLQQLQILFLELAKQRSWPGAPVTRVGSSPAWELERAPARNIPRTFPGRPGSFELKGDGFYAYITCFKAVASSLKLSVRQCKRSCDVQPSAQCHSLFGAQIPCKMALVKVRPPPPSSGGLRWEAWNLLDLRP